MKYDVHLYVTCRVKVSDVEAESQEEAIEKAEQQMRWEHLPQMEEPTHVDFTGVRWCGAADEITGALVDEHGDEDHERSRHYELPVVSESLEEVGRVLHRVMGVIENTYGRDDQGNRDDDCEPDCSGADIFEQVAGLETAVQRAIVCCTERRIPDDNGAKGQR